MKKMIILVTGTPGVGKTTVSMMLAEKLGAYLININELVDEKHIYTGIDKERGYKIVDLDALFNEIDEIIEKRNSLDEYIIVEGHLSHLFETSDLVIVLRANPDVLQDRMKTKGWNKAKIRENIEAEAIDICSYESFEIHGNNVNEIDTSDIPPEKVVDLIIDVINGDKKFPVGSVDFLSYLEKF
jgi:adenylate kinase